MIMLVGCEDDELDRLRGWRASLRCFKVELSLVRGNCDKRQGWAVSRAKTDLGMN